MKTESQKKQEHVFFLATENLVLHVNEPFRIRQDMIEMKNFVPEAFIMHHFQESKYEAIPYCNYLKLSKGEMLMSGLDPETREGSGRFSKVESPFSPDKIPQQLKDDEDEEDEDWDDEEDEDWDDEDEDWDDEEDEDWDDEDEDWDDEDGDKEGEDDWSEETES
jgi:hypothetical protein